MHEEETESFHLNKNNLKVVRFRCCVDQRFRGIWAAKKKFEIQTIIIVEPVKKNDGEEHPSLEVGNVGGKIHVAAGTRMNKRQSRKSLNYR